MEELKEIIKNSGLKATFIAEKLGLSRSAYYNKIDGKTKFNAVEISSLKEILNLSLEQVDRIFL